MSFLDRYIEKKLIKYLFIFYTIIALIEFFRAFYFFYNSPRGVIDNLNGLVLISIIDWIFVIIFMSLVSIITKYLLSKNYSWKVIITLHIILSIIQSFIVSLISPIILNYNLINSNFNLADRVVYTFFFNLTANVLLYTSIILIIYCYFYFEQIKYQENKNKILENSLIRFKLKTLENQLNPHFLFNSLNCVSSLINEDKKAAQDMLVDISELFRKYLDNNTNNSITVNEELDLLSHYVSILKKRFQEDFTFNQDVDERVTNFLIPKLIIQPLIENAIKHGYSTNKRKLFVNLEIKIVDSNYIKIEVYNNGSQLTSKTNHNNLRKGTGIKNINDRLNALYEEDYTFELKNNSSEGVVSIIIIPIQI